MNMPFIKILQTSIGWEASFAFQVFNRPADEWINMRWGFNAGALLDEALDRQKLFIESLAMTDAEFRVELTTEKKLVLRGYHLPEKGLCLALLGKVSSMSQELAIQKGQQFAKKIYSAYPYDFVLKPAETDDEYELIGCNDLIRGSSTVSQFQRASVFIPASHGHHYLTGLWQASGRSNEQIWRALFSTSKFSLLNILIQPSVLYDGEKNIFSEIKKKIASPEAGLPASQILWIDNYIKRRQTQWRKYFLMQVHVVTNEIDNEDILRSIGSALTRDSEQFSSPGYQIAASSNNNLREHLKSISSLDFASSAQHLDDIADLDEVYSIFRFPYLLGHGLPGTNFSQEEEKI